MTEDKWNKIDKLLSEFEIRLGKKLSEAQKVLLEDLTTALNGKVKFENGRIAYGQDLTPIVDEVYREFYKKGEGKFIIQFMIEQIILSSNLNVEYFSPAAPASVDVDKLSQSIKSKIYASIGLKQTGRGFQVLEGGYLNSMAQSPEVLRLLKKEMVNAVFGGKDFAELSKGLKVVITGSKDKEGVLERHYKTFAYDTLQQANRVEAKEFAVAIGLEAFQYAGNVIDTTRCFCKDKVKKVFLRSEVEDEWPDTIGETCGVIWSDNLPEYQPTKDLGGINCRHQARWITAAQAMRLDETLKYENGHLKRVA